LRRRLDKFDLGVADGARLSLSDRLPAFYREHPDVLEPLVEAAEDLLERFRDVCRLEDERVLVTRKFPSPPRSRWREEGGSQESVVRALEERCRAAPRVWSGWEALPHATGGIELVRSRVACAVLAWAREELPRVPAAQDFEAVAVPVGLRLAAVALERLPGGGNPRAGERLTGEILWRQGAGKVAGGR